MSWSGILSRRGVVRVLSEAQAGVRAGVSMGWSCALYKYWSGYFDFVCWRCVVSSWGGILNRWRVVVCSWSGMGVVDGWRGISVGGSCIGGLDVVYSVVVVVEYDV